MEQVQEIVKFILGWPMATLLGAVGGGLVSALVITITWWFERQADEERQLLSEGLAIHASKEAWVLEGPDYNIFKLSEKRQLPEISSSGLWLRKVEVRAVLDQAKWNGPEDHFYGFLSGVRTWIVRDEIQYVKDGKLKLSYPISIPYPEVHPALLSSRAMHELCGWIERVSSVWSTRFPLWPCSRLLSRHGLEMLRPLLLPVLEKTD